ncbi:NAD(P)/FAD-dependent oxidoreductase [Halonotius terrestris]|uniref:NAD(P)/FAD-dependent oxidoreductase n=1 Tax=Halonotius terrestris TaxID=2487750 RepID=A0A8J8PE58_9EURY|nr:NAD(P)/FAD-dependent oxidoreductase [Halonotius terrestris]TQQ83721.1 NAD(P)/FAD-dependent oxidoreductase [Halonotius terrestris]
MHVLVIGAYGSAGSAVAGDLAPHVGSEIDRLTLVDDGEPGGGLCILNGCMPSKEVLSTAAHRFQARVDDRLDGEPPTIDLDRVVARKDEHVESFAAHRRKSIHELADREGVEFIHDTARFVDDRVVEVAGDRYEPDYVVIATGSSPYVPELPGSDEVDYNTSKDVLAATDLPDSGIVMGFGYIGLELVPYLAEAGVDLTVIEHDDRPLDEGDPAFGDELMALYREEFDIDILTNVYEQRLEPTDDGVRLYVEDNDGAERSIEAEELFTFTGRKPTLDRLGLENTAIEPEAGWIDDTMAAVDDEQVFVVGDVNKKEPILHVAKEQGFAAADNILAHHAGEAMEPYENIHHHVVFSGASVYPFARVGHTPETAKEAGHEVVTATRWAEDDGVFKVKDVPYGLARLTVDSDTGTVLGYQGLHAHADTMAKTLQVIVENELDVREVPDRSYHPTLPELLDGLLRETAAQVE